MLAERSVEEKGHVKSPVSFFAVSRFFLFFFFAALDRNIPSGVCFYSVLGVPVVTFLTGEVLYDETRLEFFFSLFFSLEGDRVPLATPARAKRV